ALVESCVLRFFFFQAEDGIRDRTVTGVQTCALPISGHCEIRQVSARDDRRGRHVAQQRSGAPAMSATSVRAFPADTDTVRASSRSEERRVGKEWRAGGGADD